MNSKFVNIDIEVCRSRRKTMVIEVTSDARVIVRAPLRILYRGFGGYRFE